jgi:hypothetical protein
MQANTADSGRAHPEGTPSGAAVPPRPGRERPAAYYFCPDYCGQGPRVVLLVGTAWREPMRRHYGVNRAPFSSRSASPSEPSTYPNKHPWGWVFAPANAHKYEAHFRPPEALEEFELALRREIDMATPEALHPTAGPQTSAQARAALRALRTSQLADEIVAEMRGAAAMAA